jgi:AcrR family transcriptional regulator
MSEKLKDILVSTKDLFMRYGIKSMTMDDIARSLKMSKKTLYQHVSDKNDLVCKVIDEYIQLEEHVCTDIFEQFENAIDELIHITKYVSQQMKEVHPSIHYDLQKYHPDAWGAFSKHKNEFLYNCIVQNLEAGIKQGVYRKNMNTQVVAQLHIVKIDIVFNSEIFSPKQFKFSDVYLELMRYHFHGITNDKGKSYLIDKMKNENLNLY